VQLLTAAGHDVLAVSGSPAKAAYLRSLDKHHLSADGGGSLELVAAGGGGGGQQQQQQQDVSAFSKVVLKGSGAVDMVIENVGAPTMEQSLRCLKSGGKLVSE
jgi:NADPH:quinone reductase-like Zn-dependent oxidoreductase